MRQLAFGAALAAIAAVLTVPGRAPAPTRNQVPMKPAVVSDALARAGRR